jgi:hypothetical protein
MPGTLNVARAIRPSSTSRKRRAMAGSSRQANDVAGWRWGTPGGTAQA